MAAPGAKSIVFGDIKAAYVARIVAGAQTLRLAERYAEYLQVGFLGYQRLDGIVQDTSAAAVLEAQGRVVRSRGRAAPSPPPRVSKPPSTRKERP